MTGCKNCCCYINSVKKISIGTLKNLQKYKGDIVWPGALSAIKMNLNKAQLIVKVKTQSTYHSQGQWDSFTDGVMVL